MRAAQLRRQSAEELMLLNCGSGEDSSECLESKEIKPVNPEGNQPEHSLEGQMLKLSSSTLAT